MTAVLDILDRLISFDTVSAKPNQDIVAYIVEYLTGRGARITRIDGHEDGKSGLVAVLGPDTDGGAILSAHTDVVPVEGQDWTRPPFALTRQADRLYGRGTTDMKGFIACMLYAADEATRQPLRTPLKLVLSYDEEIGCVGIQHMAATLLPLLGTPRACIVGEPTSMRVATGHKGKIAMTATCHGEAGHSALAPNFVNALDLAADMVLALRHVQHGLARSGVQDADFDIPYSTVHVGRLTGGRALNIVPDNAELLFELRHLAADDAQTILADIQSAARAIATQYGAAAKITFEKGAAYPGLDVAESDPAVRWGLALAGTQTTKVAFGTEAGVFQNMGIPSIVCGPGSMAGQGHKADEYIELAQLNACTQMMDRLVKDLCA